MGSGRRTVGIPIHEVVIRCFRQAGFSSQEKFAEAVGVTPTYVSYLLRPPDKGGRVPSQTVIKRIADKCGRNPRQREMYLGLLLQARLSHAYPSAIPAVSASAVPPRQMPKAFIQRLHKDVSQFGERRLRDRLRSVGVTYKLIQAVLRGDAVLDRWQIAKVAKALSAPVVDYARLSQMLPPHILSVADKNPLVLTDMSELGRRAFNDMTRRLGRTSTGRGKKG